MDVKGQEKEKEKIGLARLAIPLFLPLKGNRQIFSLKNTEK